MLGLKILRLIILIPELFFFFSFHYPLSSLSFSVLSCLRPNKHKLFSFCCSFNLGKISRNTAAWSLHLHLQNLDSFIVQVPDCRRLRCFDRKSVISSAAVRIIGLVSGYNDNCYCMYYYSQNTTLPCSAVKLLTSDTCRLVKFSSSYAIASDCWADCKQWVLLKSFPHHASVYVCYIWLY